MAVTRTDLSPGMFLKLGSTELVKSISLRHPSSLVR